MTPHAGNPAPGTRPQGSVARTIKAVAWSLIGLRKGSEYREDLQRINPLHVIAVGLVAIFLLVAVLVGLVHWIV